MSTTTAKLGLFKPELTDPADITQMNQNWDKIDEKLNNIPITSEVPSDAEMWIDPNEVSAEESHLINMNNPHNVTIEQIGAAPDGYGLGENVAASTADINVVSPARFFKTTSSTANLSQASRNVGIAIPYATDEVAQLLIRTSTGSVRVRRFYNGVWTEEWVNPPMADGAEYQTVERSAGNVVYAKRVSYTFTQDIGSDSGYTDITIPHGIENFKRLVRVVAISNTYQLPYISANGGNFGLKGVDTVNISLRAYKASFGPHTMTFDVYYTKS